MGSSKPILLVEDDDVDAMTTKKALDELEFTNELIRKVDGEEALEYLQQDDKQLPYFILLDLNMPRMNGLEFLKVIKDEQILKRIPVVVLTTSETEQNIVDSYELGVAGYVVKSVDYKQFIESMRTITEYWALSRVPEREQ
jgi:CheY-like chemotaxis protein